MSDAAVISRFMELQQSGRSAAQIATIMNVTTRTVTRWRKQTGTSTTGTVVKLPQETRQQARDLVEAGCSFAEAARTVGVTPATIRRWFPDAIAWTKNQAGEYRQILQFEWDMEGRAA